MGNQSGRLQFQRMTLAQYKTNNQIKIPSVVKRALNAMPFQQAQQYVLNMDNKHVQKNQNQSSLTLQIRKKNTNTFYTLKEFLFNNHQQPQYNRFLKYIRDRMQVIYKCQNIIGYQSLFTHKNQDFCSAQFSIYTIFRSAQYLKTLEQLIQQDRRITLQEVWRIIQGCVCALSCLQKQKVRYSKIRSGNIILQVQSDVFQKEQFIKNVKIMDPILALSSAQVSRQQSQQQKQYNRHHYNIFKAYQNREDLLLSSKRSSNCKIYKENNSSLIKQCDLCSNDIDSVNKGKNSFFNLQLKFQKKGMHSSNSKDKQYRQDFYQKFYPPQISPQQYKLIQSNVITANYDHYKSDVYVFGCLIFGILWNDYNQYKPKTHQISSALERNTLNSVNSDSLRNESKSAGKSVYNKSRKLQVNQYEALYKNVTVDKKFQEISNKLKKLKLQFHRDGVQSPVRSKIIYIIEKMLQNQISIRFNWLQLARQLHKIQENKDKIVEQEIRYRNQMEQLLQRKHKRQRTISFEDRVFQTGNKKNESIQILKKLDLRYLQDEEQIARTASHKKKISEQFPQSWKKSNANVSWNANDQRMIQAFILKKTISYGSFNAYENVPKGVLNEIIEQKHHIAIQNKGLEDMDDKITIKTRKLRYHKKNKTSKHERNEDSKNEDVGKNLKSMREGHSKNQFQNQSNVYFEKKPNIKLSLCHPDSLKSLQKEPKNVHVMPKRIKTQRQMFQNSNRKIQSQPTPKAVSPTFINLGRKFNLKSSTPKQKSNQQFRQHKNQVLYKESKQKQQTDKFKSENKSKFFTSIPRQTPRSLSQTEFPSLSLSENKTALNMSNQFSKIRNIKDNINLQQQWTQGQKASKGIYIKSTGQYLPLYGTNQQLQNYKNSFNKHGCIPNSKQFQCYLINKDRQYDQVQNPPIGEKLIKLIRKTSKDINSIQNSQLQSEGAYQYQKYEPHKKMDNHFQNPQGFYRLKNQQSKKQQTSQQKQESSISSIQNNEFLDQASFDYNIQSNVKQYAIKHISQRYSHVDFPEDHCVSIQQYQSPCQNNQNQSELRQQFVTTANQELTDKQKIMSVQSIMTNIVKIQYSDGGYYLGNIFEGNKNGYGQLTYPETNRFAYIGQWKNDCFHGYGHLFNQFPQEAIKVTNNDTQDFLKIAKQINFLNFDKIGNKWLKYFGKFEMDKKCGKGTIFLTNGYKFCGHFLNDMVHGQGLLVKQNKPRKSQKISSLVSIERQSEYLLEEKQIKEQFSKVQNQEMQQGPKQLYSQVKIGDKIILRGIWEYNQLIKIQSFKQ